MATTKITANVLAPSSAQTNINSGSSFNVTVPTTFTTNVGIGTTIPNEKLTVTGNLSASGNAYAGGNKLAAENFAVAMAIALG